MTRKRKIKLVTLVSLTLLSLQGPAADAKEYEKGRMWDYYRGREWRNRNEKEEHEKAIKKMDAERKARDLQRFKETGEESLEMKWDREKREKEENEAKDAQNAADQKHASAVRAREKLRRQQQAEAMKQEQQQLATVEKLRKSGKASQAVAMLESMAVSGSPNAPYELGKAYFKGEGVKADKTKAFSWFYKAARLGNGNASYELAHAYLEGDGVKQDNKQALDWLRVSTAPRARNILGSMYLDGGEGIARDYHKAWDMLRAAATQNDDLAKASLGEICYLGLGMRQNFMEAKKWLEAGAAANNPKALFYLSQMYATGNGVGKDETKAREYMTRYDEAVAKLPAQNNNENKIVYKEYAQMSTRMERLSKDTIPAAPLPVAQKKPIAKVTTIASAPQASKTQSSPPQPEPEKKKEPPKSKSRTEVYTAVEELVRKYYPKAKIEKNDQGMHFEFKTTPTEEIRGKQKMIPKLGGIVGDIKATKGHYPGKEYLPYQTNGTLYVFLLMAPYSAEEDDHLLTKLMFPPDAPLDFVSSFKTLVSMYTK
ncbi:MAG: SEL1-like repeat protein [Candidatus Melainabacteria bacterium]|nr:SEL1-like repeat protein [Candidatus Melainabacteria bacterium]